MGRFKLLLERYDTQESPVSKTKYINKVYDTERIARSLSMDLAEHKLIWVREEPREVTIEEIQRELGYKIKIVE